MTHALPPPVPPSPAESAPLAHWLEWLETIHPVAIDMGLDRVSAVADRLALRPVTQPLVLVGGTNGKGSTVAMLSAIYKAAGYRVGAYSSPHIHDFRERIRVDGDMADAAAIVQALSFVETGRAPQTLTYFEYTTLAAMRVFQQSQCDVYVLEVGLGGRLDATNLWDADCAVLTSIALDHQEYLGSDIRVIATEKAAIGRRGRQLIVGETHPPDSLFSYALDNGISVVPVGESPQAELPECALPGAHQRRNAGCAKAVVDALQNKLPVDPAAVSAGLMHVQLAARFEHREAHGVSVIFDVAHNPAGALALTEAWQERFPGRKAQLIFACLADKDMAGIVAALEPIADTWHCLELTGPRALSVSQLVDALEETSTASVCAHETAQSAAEHAFSQARQSGQPVLVAGSFHTIGDVRQAIESLAPA